MKVIRDNLVRKQCPCPTCGKIAKRHSRKQRTVRDIDAIRHIAISVHYCESCRKYFRVSSDHIAPASSRFSNRVREETLALVTMRGMSLVRASREMRNRFNVIIPTTTIFDWREALA